MEEVSVFSLIFPQGKGASHAHEEYLFSLTSASLEQLTQEPLKLGGCLKERVLPSKEEYRGPRRKDKQTNAGPCVFKLQIVCGHVRVYARYEGAGTSLSSIFWIDRWY